MKTILLASLSMATALAVAVPVSALTNLGSGAPAVFEGHDISPDDGGPRLLYAPSEGDDAEYRARMAYHVGGTCDYFDARAETPSAGLLASYDCVMTWANYSYADATGFGDRLADFVDGGGKVVLGAFAAYTSGNHLSGRIMTDTSRYCPVVGGINHFTLSMWDGSDQGYCAHLGVTSYGCTYRDFLTLVGPGAQVAGHFEDGEIANAGNAMGNVTYANGAGGFPLFPVGGDAERVSNSCACACCGPTAAEPATWGATKTIYR